MTPKSIVDSPLHSKREEPIRVQKKQHQKKASSKPRGARGIPGPGGGSATVIDPPTEYRGTSVQVCGLWPFSVGASSPICGVPLGRHLQTGGVVTGDPISFFTRARLISNPSAFVLGKPGLGKSSLVRHIATGLSAYGVSPIVVGDLKGEYVDLVEALDGQVLRIGRGLGHLNVLDPGASYDTAALLEREATRLRDAAAEHEKQGQEEEAAQALTQAARARETAKAVLADVHGRCLNLVSALISIVRKRAPSDREHSILDAALRALQQEHKEIPLLGDLLRVIQDRHPLVRAVAVDRGSDQRYMDITEDLEASLLSIVQGGRLGETFSKPTSIDMRTDRAVVFDVSGIDDTDKDLQAATLLACWSQGFASVEASHALSDLGLAPRRHFLIVLDELWRVLRAGPEMVDLVDAVTRLNRSIGVGQVMISHTMSDLLALGSEPERMKAKGFVERSGMVFLGGLPSSEMPLLTGVVPLSRAEQGMLTEWQDPPAWDAVRGREAEPPGRGKFLLKIGGKPGVPFRVQLTPTELAINDTNERWKE